MSTQMAGGDQTMIVEEPGKAQTGRKKRMNLRIGGPGVLVGALAVAFVIGAAIRIRRYRSLHKARKRFQGRSMDDSNGGLRSILQADKDYPRYCVGGTSETTLNRTLEEKGLEEGSKLGQDTMKNDLSEDEIQIGIIGEDEGNEASETDDGEWMTKEVMESRAEEEQDSANEAQGEEDYDDAEDEDAASEAEEENAENEDADNEDEVADNEAEEENDDADNDDEDEDGDDGEYVIVKCDKGLPRTEDSSMESNAEVVWPVEMEERPLEIQDMKISYQDDKLAKTQAYNCLNEMEGRIPMKIKLRIWIWTALMLLLLLLLSVTNQKSYVSLSL